MTTVTTWTYHNANVIIIRTRAEKKMSTYERIANCPAGVAAAKVKLADRIANIKFSKEFGSKLDMYREEQEDFEHLALRPYRDNPLFR